MNKNAQQTEESHALRLTKAFIAGAVFFLFGVVFAETTSELGGLIMKAAGLFVVVGVVVLMCGKELSHLWRDGSGDHIDTSGDSSMRVNPPEPFQPWS